MNNRIQIGDHAINQAFALGRAHTEAVLFRKGRGTFSSRHEILGVMETEYLELRMAIQSHAKMNDVRHELMDIMQICAFGLACIDSGACDW